MSEQEIELVSMWAPPAATARNEYRPPERVELVEVIRVTTLRGSGRNPVRRVVQYWSKDGNLLAEADEH